MVQPMPRSFVLRPSNRHPRQMQVLFTDRQPPIRRLRTSSSSLSRNNNKSHSEDTDDESLDENELDVVKAPVPTPAYSKAGSPDTTGAVKTPSGRSRLSPKARSRKPKRDDDDDETDAKDPATTVPPSPKRRRASPPPLSTSHPPDKRPRTTILPWHKAIRDTSTPNWMLESVRRELRGDEPTTGQYHPDQSNIPLHPDFEPPSDSNYWKKRCFYWQEICQGQRGRLRELEEDQRQLRRRIWQLEEQVIWTANRSSSRFVQQVLEASNSEPAKHSQQPRSEGSSRRDTSTEAAKASRPPATDDSSKTNDKDKDTNIRQETRNVPVSPEEPRQERVRPPTWIVTVSRPRRPCSFYLTDGEGLSDSEEPMDDDDDEDDDDEDEDCGCCHGHHDRTGQGKDKGLLTENDGSNHVTASKPATVIQAETESQQATTTSQKEGTTKDAKGISKQDPNSPSCNAGPQMEKDVDVEHRKSSSNDTPTSQEVSNEIFRV